MYLESTNRWLIATWRLKVNILYNSVFRDSQTGYYNVANRIAADQQAEGIRLKPYNTLTNSDVEKILTHPCTSEATPGGYVSKLIVVIGLFLRLRKHDEMDYKVRPCLRYERIIGSVEGISKANSGGLSAAKSLPVSILLLDEDLAYDINPYNYLSLIGITVREQATALICSCPQLQETIQCLNLEEIANW